MLKPLARIFIIVVIKFIEPTNDETPEMCKLKINKSTEGPECDCIPLSGGYMVQPVPAPFSIANDNKTSWIEPGNNQKLKAFNLGNAISGAPNIKGTKKFPNAPSKTGITKKKIIITPCAETIELYNC
jgi:hypothetical protein